jgi:ATP-dependent DNA helicase RecG
LTVEDLLQEHQSKLWNPIIANTLYRRGVIESWGRGTLNMIGSSRRAGFRSPEFVNSRLSFTVRFFAEGYMAPTRISRDLTRLQQEILMVLRELGPSPTRVIVDHLSEPVDQRIISRSLQTLRDYGLVGLSGERRWAQWYLIINQESYNN